MIIVEQSNIAEISAKLAAGDARLKSVLDRFGVPPLWSREPDFPTLVHIILEQQVSLASARAAFEKLRARVGEITPENLVALSDDELKACYFSRQKTVYARSLATAVLEGDLELEALAEMPDDRVRAELKKLKGIGDWTADIFLLMALGRADVMPRGDIALHAACARLYGLDDRPRADDFLVFAERWRPYRAVAARILWHYYLSSPGEFRRRASK